MPLLLDTKPADAAAVELRSRNCIEIGLVNNMPDAALEATERQFVELIRAATADSVVRLRLFALPDVPRGDRGRQEIAARYRDVAELWDTRLDGLVVTGTEPRTADLKEEPYWPTLAKLVGRATTLLPRSGRASPRTRRCYTPTASSGFRCRRSSLACSIAGW
jgi:homoserine O-succinyltransferase